MADILTVSQAGLANDGPWYTRCHCTLDFDRLFEAITLLPLSVVGAAPRVNDS